MSISLETMGIFSTATNTAALASANYQTQNTPLETFLDRLLLLSPRTWLGILEIQDLNEASPFSMAVFKESVAGLLVPLLLCWVLQNVLTTLSTRIPSLAEASSSRFGLKPMQFLLVTLLSPWVLQCGHKTWQQLAVIWPAIQNYRTGRAVALQEANDIFQERVSSGRAYHKRRYDVYLPETTTTANRALLFVPGALIPTVAYAQVASQLSDAGFMVVVVSMEPTRLAYHHLGSDQTSLRRIMQKVQKQQEQPDTKLQWTIMGHSMGSFAASRFFDKMVRQGYCRPSGNLVICNKLVLWGVAAFNRFVTNLTDHGATDVLVIQGTKDELREMLKDGNQALQASFPPRTTTEYIKGGTHDGFGCYQSPAIPTHISDKSRRKQQEQACKLTAEFILQER